MYKVKIDKYVVVRKCFPDDSGAEILPGEMHVYLLAEEPQAVNFICPCGCGSHCYTPITTKARQRDGQRPMWDFSHGPNGPTLTPSIRWTGGCKAHFNITDGKVITHGDSGK